MTGLPLGTLVFGYEGPAEETLGFIKKVAKLITLKFSKWGGWVAQLVRLVTLDLRVMS